MDADTRAKLAEGVADLVSRIAAGAEWLYTDATGAERGGYSHVEVRCSLYPPPAHLTAFQLLCLRGLVGDTDSGLVAAAVDAMVEAGVVPAETVEMVRQAERERCAMIADFNEQVNRRHVTYANDRAADVAAYIAKGIRDYSP